MTETHEERIARYRRLAAEAEKRAAMSVPHNVCSTYLAIARSWKALADEVESANPNSN